MGSDSFGADYLKHLKELGIDVTCVQIVDCMSGVAQICVDENGELLKNVGFKKRRRTSSSIFPPRRLSFSFVLGDNNIVIITGANDYLNLDDVTAARSLIEKSKVVMFQFETPLETSVKALELCKTYSCT